MGSLINCSVSRVPPHGHIIGEILLFIISWQGVAVKASVRKGKTTGSFLLVCLQEDESRPDLSPVVNVRTFPGRPSWPGQPGRAQGDAPLREWQMVRYCNHLLHSPMAFRQDDIYFRFWFGFFSANFYQSVSTEVMANGKPSEHL